MKQIWTCAALLHVNVVALASMEKTSIPVHVHQTSLEPGVLKQGHFVHLHLAGIMEHAM